jgi:hypothetical protein
VFALIPYDVWAAAAIAVGVEWSAVAHHVGLAVVVSRLCLGSALISSSRLLATRSADRPVIADLIRNLAACGPKQTSTSYRANVC